MKERLLMNLALGMNTNADPSALAPDRTGKVWLSSSLNVVVGDTGRVERCLGKSIHQTVTSCHSMHSIPGGFCYVSDGTLKLSNNQFLALTYSGRMSYAQVDDRVFYSNGADIGFIRDGEIIPLPAGTWTGPESTRKFETIPSGHLLCYALGRMFIAKDSSIWFSEPRNLYLYSPASNRFTYRSRIRMMAGLKNGLWVSDGEAIYWIAFNDGNWQQTVKAAYPALEGEPAKINVAEMPMENLFGVGYLCPTVRGICLLGPDGVFVNLTEKVMELRYPDGIPLPLEYFDGIVNRNRYYCHLWGDVSIGLILNLANLAVTQQSVYAFKSVCQAENICYGAFADGIYTLFELWPRVDADFSFWFDAGRLCRFRYLHLHGEFSDDVQVVLTCDETTERTYTAEIRRTAGKQHEIKVPVARDNGIGTYWKVKIKNINGRYFAINRITADVIYRR